MDHSDVTRLPEWIRKERINLQELHDMKVTLRRQGLHTVCESAMCPNRGECFKKGTATFLLLGDVCTRNCGFCNVLSGRPETLDVGEPGRIANTVHEMGIRYVVLTMVNRDDLSDGGAEIVAETARKIKEVSPGAKVEALVGDFQGNRDALRIILDCPIDVFNHNIEMVERLFPRIRPKANYRQSLAILKLAATETTTPTKSGFMVGLGETDEEIQVLMSDLREAGVTILTIGQYLRPSVRNIKVAKYYTPEEFDNLAERGEKMGFSYVFAGPFVRSSYMAEEVFGAVAHG
ncbi:MAG: lipoyl synthase [Acidobacteria bacterium CG_4_9_14_3_um_filter_49_7]|nr:MAG: lipoyl synthase [Acidobacteria bacterium CG_4_9_14_3_um_filter_49_7]